MIITAIKLRTAITGINKRLWKKDVDPIINFHSLIFFYLFF
uniref:Uncharacterized protein n=1 Tax=Lepeophtheirus salmonis TaxID=72036 RepID=A0A0K2UKQ0_LEPSM